jgi:hypothetical protein
VDQDRRRDPRKGNRNQSQKRATRDRPGLAHRCGVRCR